MDLVEIWRNTLGELQVTLSKANFETWFKLTFIFEFKKGICVIGVPTFFVEDWLKKKYFKEIEAALQNQIDEPIAAIKFKIAPPSSDQVVTFEKNKVIHKPVDKPQEKNTVFVQSLTQSSNLKSEYVFENFVVGSSNELAYAAAQAVVEKPGTQYNPLYIYGDSGLGKTHLMQAVGNAFLMKNPDKKVIYVSTENFVNDFIQAVSSGFGKAKNFKDRYRNIDLLLIDDIQFLSSKEGTQEEFFHTFNHLYQNQKQVILTSDRTPKEIKGLEVRLKTRFEGGMVCDIIQPDVETREAILWHKAQNLNIQIEDKLIITFIAENITSSIRELEGSLNKIVATCELLKTPLTLEKTKELLAGFIEEKKRALTPDLIIAEVHKYYKIPIEDILGRRRTKDLVLPRQITMYLLRHECNMSYPLVGKEMGGKDHSTIIHGCEKIEKNISVDPRINEDVKKIKENIIARFNI